jgi:hypothetical protein
MDCGYIWTIEYDQLKENVGLNFCPNCSAVGEPENLDSIIGYNIELQIEINLDRWFAENGIEGTLEMLERNKNSLTPKIQWLYSEALANRGLYLK